MADARPQVRRQETGRLDAATQCFGYGHQHRFHNSQRLFAATGATLNFADEMVDEIRGVRVFPRKFVVPISHELTLSILFVIVERVLKYRIRQDHYLFRVFQM